MPSVPESKSVPLSSDESKQLIKDCQAFLKEQKWTDWLETGVPGESVTDKSVLWKENFEGTWQINLKKSEPTEDIMSLLGISKIKRSVMKKATPTTTIKVLADGAVNLSTKFPLGVVKQGQLHVDPVLCEQSDTEPKARWSNLSCLHDDGVLYQRRTSELGTMYDIRKTVKAEEGKREMHFIWALQCPEKGDAVCLRVMDEVN